MKRYCTIFAVIFCGWPGLAPAGTVDQKPAESVQPAAKHSFLDPIGDFIHDDILHPVAPFELVPGKDANGWSFSLEPYVWVMGLSGNLGIKGLPPASMSFNSRTVLQSLDWGIFARGEVRKGRWGLLADGYYAALSNTLDFQNKLYDSADIAVQQSIVSLALAYRIVDDSRGYLDIYAGARYNYLGTQASASLNDSRINDIGNNVADAISARVDTQIDSVIQSVLAKALAEAQSEVAQVVGERVTSRIVKGEMMGDGDLRRLVRSQVLRGSLTGGDVGKALAEYIQAAAKAQVAAAKGAIDPKLEATAAAAKKKLGKAIASRIEDVTPTYGAADQWWFDPIIGLRGQVNFTRWLFLAAQGDVGGFGAGSQIAWNVQATLGVNFTRNVFAEIGYRYMYVDYTNGGFLYQMNSYGLYSGIGVKL